MDLIFLLPTRALRKVRSKTQMYIKSSFQTDHLGNYLTVRAFLEFQVLPTPSKPQPPTPSQLPACSVQQHSPIAHSCSLSTHLSLTSGMGTSKRVPEGARIARRVSPVKTEQVGTHRAQAVPMLTKSPWHFSKSTQLSLFWRTAIYTHSSC